jgi:hypothetical protein
VIDLPKSQHPSIRLSVMLLALGLCVFFWGLGYKLSLYQAHATSVQRIPEAKLLSHNEDRNATDGVRLCLAKAELPGQGNPIALFLFLGVISAAGLRVQRDRQYLSTPKPWCSDFSANRSELFLRPPPLVSQL